MSTSSQFPDENRDDGEFERQEDAFRHWVRRDGSTAFTPDADPYHLYISLACPWAHHTLIARHLKNLDAVIGATIFLRLFVGHSNEGEFKSQKAPSILPLTQYFYGFLASELVRLRRLSRSLQPISRHHPYIPTR